ncbi:MAG: hypothetical protein LBD67_10520 [Candidatus Accumulibacter sp.]|jgi:hypothetical protein|nr:hypothetical protein [Accumulibacter sp.]
MKNIYIRILIFIFSLFSQVAWAAPPDFIGGMFGGAFNFNWIQIEITVLLVAAGIFCVLWVLEAIKLILEQFGYKKKGYRNTRGYRSSFGSVRSGRSYYFRGSRSVTLILR